MPYSAKFEQWIALRLSEVFEFFGNPENLPRIMPPWMNIRVEDSKLVSPPEAPRDKPIAGEGSSLTISFRAVPVLPFRVRSNARIVAFAMNQFFEDAHSDMLFKSWHHRHEFGSEERAGVSGTIIGDIITYELTFGPISSLMNSLFVAPEMRRTFEYRQRVVERLLL